MSEKNRGIIRIPQQVPGGEQDPIARARYFSDNGADEILVFDCSKTEEDHETAIGILKEICRASEVPVKAGGHIERAEDVKKLLYAGCAKVILNYAKQSNIDLAEDVSKRFGKERIAASVDSSDVVSAPAALAEEYVSELISMDELKLFEEKLRPLSCNMDWAEFKLGPDGLVPVVVQDYRTDEVLMLAYMNEEAFEKTISLGKMTYYSRSRGELWMKGETSGHIQYVKSLTADCDYDTILAKVSQIGAACHTGNPSCFFNTIVKKEYVEKNPQKVFEEVYAIIMDRKANPKEGSYTTYLFEKGIDKILKKLGEENAETIIAAKNPNPEEIKYEISDYLYHLMVLMADKGITWEDVTQELSQR